MSDPQKKHRRLLLVIITVLAASTALATVTAVQMYLLVQVPPNIQLAEGAGPESMSTGLTSVVLASNTRNPSELYPLTLDNVAISLVATCPGLNQTVPYTIEWPLNYNVTINGINYQGSGNAVTGSDSTSTNGSVRLSTLTLSSPRDSIYLKLNASIPPTCIASQGYLFSVYLNAQIPVKLFGLITVTEIQIDPSITSLVSAPPI